MAKQSSPELSSLAAKVMGGYEPTRKEIVSLAASVLGQDETPAGLKVDMEESVRQGRTVVVADPYEGQTMEGRPIEYPDEALDKLEHGDPLGR